MPPIVKVTGLRKKYDTGFEALKGVDLEIEEGEIIALLGPNGAGKTTLISAICGIAVPTAGTITVGGHDAIRDYRAARELIGLVPQEINLEPFERVQNTVRFSRGLFGKSPNEAHIQDILSQLSLGEKARARVRELSGGMKRRVLIAKALAHEPRILFLDEPTAGVDVSLRKDMWAIVSDLRASGVTIILTTHYIEEAEEIADRIGVINHGELILVEEKRALMAKLGKKQLELELFDPLEELPSSLAPFGIEQSANGLKLIYTFETTESGENNISSVLEALREAGITFKDLHTSQSSLEEIFVGLVNQPADGAAQGAAT